MPYAQLKTFYQQEVYNEKTKKGEQGLVFRYKDFLATHSLLTRKSGAQLRLKNPKLRFLSHDGGVFCFEKNTKSLLKYSKTRSP